jgi:hypothetical protein
MPWTAPLHEQGPGRTEGRPKPVSLTTTHPIERWSHA